MSEMWLAWVTGFLTLLPLAAVGCWWPCRCRSSSSSSSSSDSLSSSSSSSSSSSAYYATTCQGCEAGWAGSYAVSVSSVTRRPPGGTGVTTGCCDDECSDSSGTLIFDLQPGYSTNGSGPCSAQYSISLPSEGCTFAGGILTVTRIRTSPPCYRLDVGFKFGCQIDSLHLHPPDCTPSLASFTSSVSDSYNADGSLCPNTCRVSGSGHAGPGSGVQRGCCGEEFDWTASPA